VPATVTCCSSGGVSIHCRSQNPRRRVASALRPTAARPAVRRARFRRACLDVSSVVARSQVLPSGVHREAVHLVGICLKSLHGGDATAASLEASCTLPAVRTALPCSQLALLGHRVAARRTPA